MDVKSTESFSMKTEEGDHMGNFDVDGRITFRYILKQ
jgi:hypothetical protein